MKTENWQSTLNEVEEKHLFEYFFARGDAFMQSARKVSIETRIIC